ncbi:MAG: efflux RND transporter periplasmic adaptor subunit [Planctomycetes bacterium]|nr:efflux RND transporter periplasmic adaptor subunit [Planctomycetota bacterium]
MNEAAKGGNPPQPMPENGTQASKFAAVWGALPTLAILVALGGVAFWGHHTGWTLPSFDELTADGSETTADWCEAHKVPESLCVECNLDEYPRPAYYGWDEDYGVFNNPERHPDLAQVNGTPQLPKYDTLAALRVMDRQENDPKCPLHLPRLQFASLEAAEKMGVEFEVVSERPMEDHVVANAEVVYEPTAVARVSSPVGGRVWQVRTQLGNAVAAGDVLALIDSPGIADAKGNYIEAVIAMQTKEEEYQTLLQVSETVSVGRMTLVEAKSARDGAKSRLTRTIQLLANLGLNVPTSVSELDPDTLNEEMRFLGIPESLRVDIAESTSTSSLFPLTAPQAGIVTELNLATGEVVDTRDVLGVVANREKMMVSMSVTAEHSKYVREGLTVRFVSDVGEITVDGVVKWISNSVDDISRQLEVRATITAIPANLRANTFGTAYIILRQEPNAVVVPRSAVQWEGDCNVVFVRDKNFRKPDYPKVIHVRKVRPGASDGEFVELLAGVLPGEVVVSAGAGILRGQMLANKLGAG